MAFEDLLVASIRLTILKALEQDCGFSHNESILHSIVVEFGHKCGRDKIRTELAWLKEQGLVTLKDVSGLFVATITDRGVDAATGNVTVPGVQRPRPGN